MQLEYSILVISVKKENKARKGWHRTMLEEVQLMS